MKRHVTVVQSWEITIDIPDKNIDEVTKCYQDIMDSHVCDVDEIFDHIAYNYCINDCKEFVEGVGNLKEAEISVKSIDHYTDVDVREEG